MNDNTASGVQLTEAEIDAAMEAFNSFPCPMNGSVVRTGNREHIGAAIVAARGAAPSLRAMEARVTRHVRATLNLIANSFANCEGNAATMRDLATDCLRDLDAALIAAPAGYPGELVSARDTVGIAGHQAEIAREREAVVYIQRDHLEHAMRGAFLCRVEATFREGMNLVPLAHPRLTHPQSASASGGERDASLAGLHKNDAAATANVHELVSPAAVGADEVDAEVVDVGLNGLELDARATADADPHGGLEAGSGELHDSRSATCVQARKCDLPEADGLKPEQTASMRMAKADDADIQALLDVVSVIESMAKGWMPELALETGDDKPDDDFFDRDYPAHCRYVVDMLLRAEMRGGLFRAAFGLTVLLSPRNELVDPDADHITKHPNIVRALAAQAANDANGARYRFLLELLLEKGVLHQYTEHTWVLRGIYGVDDSGMRGVGTSPEMAIDNAIKASMKLKGA